MKGAAIVAAGGLGSRLNQDVPKQLLLLGGLPLFLWSVLALEKVERIHEIVLVVPGGGMPDFQKAAQGVSKLKWTTGGARRQDSVRHGLDIVTAALEVVLVHDAARPFISPQLVDLLIDTASERGAAIPVTPVTETLKEISHAQVIRTVDRSRIFCAQTPQVFRREALVRVFQSVPQDRVWTDEASMFEFVGLPVAAVAGDKRNIKITYPEDFQYAEHLLGQIQKG
ncbi:MAG: 2-C-methyl-D-erythritol 4-phosphate cytidylyltransferase [Acidobacteria bacterium]|nr:2-C-methyl-D-erythritol 4-phosphate cytidylyltransferase [Acidobacteriota bacterium]